MLTFDSQKEALTALRDRQTQFPQVTQTYRASGKTTKEALLGMAGGAVLGGLSGAAVTGLLLGLAWALTIGAWILYSNTRTEVSGIVLLAHLIVGGATVLGACIQGGRVTGKIVESRGRPGKNRSPAAAGGFAVLGAALAGGILYLMAQQDWVRNSFSILQTFDPFSFGTISSRTLLVLSGAGMGITALSAFLVAWAEAGKLIFCEECLHWMEESKFVTSWHVGEQLKAGGDARGWLPVAETIRDQPGSDVVAFLTVCPQCGRGYLEAMVNFDAAWPEGGTQKTLKQTWLFYSISLDQTAASMVRVIKGKSGVTGASASA